MPSPGNERYCRVSDVVRREVGAATFLLLPARNTIHELNATGAAVWEHLAEASSGVEILDSLAIAFPAAERAAIRRDVASLLDELVRAGLAVRCQ